MNSNIEQKVREALIKYKTGCIDNYMTLDQATQAIMGLIEEIFK